MIRALRSIPLSLALGAGLLLGGAPHLAIAQTHASEMTEFNAGDIKYRTHIYFEFVAETAPQVVLAPGDGLSGATFRYRPDGSASWGKMLRERGFNVYMLDNVGCGNAIEPPSTDFPTLADMGRFGVEQIALATAPRLLIAHGEAAGFAIKARSLNEGAGDALVLIDPIGPQGSQPMSTLSSAEVLERWQDRQNRVWRRWGFGPEYGKLRRGVDVTEAVARQIVDGYEEDQPAYWAALLTPMDLPLQVRDGFLLADLPVLVIRTQGADREQIERENAVVAWLENFGTHVDRLDLTRDPELKNTSGLPWVGDLSEPALERILTWREQVATNPNPGR